MKIWTLRLEGGCRRGVLGHRGRLPGHRPEHDHRNADHTAGPRNHHTTGLVTSLHQSNVDISNMGIATNNAVLATWFT
jgi:hypothetical protein